MMLPPSAMQILAPQAIFFFHHAKIVTNIRFGKRKNRGGPRAPLGPRARVSSPPLDHSSYATVAWLDEV